MLNKLIKLLKPEDAEVIDIRTEIQQRNAYAGINVDLIPHEWLKNVLNAPSGRILSVGSGSRLTCDLDSTILCGDVDIHVTTMPFAEVIFHPSSFAVLLDVDYKAPVFVYV